MLPALETFILDFRALYNEDISDAERFERGRPFLKTLLADKSLEQCAEKWPARNDPDQGYFENLLFYEDPDYGFVINALIKEPGESTPIHDHGEVLTVYGVFVGGEIVKRFRRVDLGAGENGAPGTDNGIELELIGEEAVTPGYIDFVPPGEIHVEHNGQHRTIGLILRNGNVGDHLQSWYNKESGTRVRRYGPKQIPYQLA